MIKFGISEAASRVEQAQAILSLWLELSHGNSREVSLIGSILTVLSGLPDVIRGADCELFEYDLLRRNLGKEPEIARGEESQARLERELKI
ncbi:TPA: hypothetical protein ACT2TS_002464 [Citrobacter braakii]|nr:hypothetical protein [Citrobacter freundii]